MKISELKEGKADMKGAVIQLEGPKPTATKFGERSRTWVLVQDETGKIGGSLWGKNAERIALGDELEMFDVPIENYKGQLQFTTNKDTKVRITKPPTQAVISKYQGEIPAKAVAAEAATGIVAPTVSQFSAAESPGPAPSQRFGRLAVGPGANPSTIKSQIDKARNGIRIYDDALDELERQLFG